MNRCSKLLCTIVASVAALALNGCDWHMDHTGPIETMPISVALGSADRSKLELDLAAGQLQLSGGASDLLQGTVDYNVPEWKPVLHVSNIGTSTDVVLKQPETHSFPSGDHQYRWNLKVNDGVLLDVAINCGAGQQDLKLGDAKLRSVMVHIGAGQVTLDLRGHPTRDYDVNISGGVGQARVTLPASAGIWAEAHGGIGHIDVQGLIKKGDHWESADYDTAKANIRVRVEGGIGQIDIRTE